MIQSADFSFDNPETIQRITRAMHRAYQAMLIEKARLNRPVVIMRDGQICYVPAAELLHEFYDKQKAVE
jgi:hypothetical protein